MTSLLELLRLDRSVISFGDVADQSREYREAILALPVSERLRAVEFLRQVRHGPELASARIERVLTIVDRDKK